MDNESNISNKTENISLNEKSTISSNKNSTSSLSKNKKISSLSTSGASKDKLNEQKISIISPKYYDYIADKYEKYILNTYGDRMLDVHYGIGVEIADFAGKKYIDFLSGISVNCLGYFHPTIASTIQRESKKLLHTSNLFYTNNQVDLAEIIINNSFPGKVFFCNSGAEANETAIKIFRKFGNDHGNKDEIVSFKNSFHGRTFASLSITGQEKYQNGFGPLLQGVKFAEFNNTDDFLSIVSPKTAGVIIELIQAEGGINVAKPDFIKTIYDYCQKNDVLFAIDEVQTGIGRTGKKFCFQHYDIIPDIMTLAKGLGGGLPIGAAVIGERCEKVLQPGLHASTFGGNSLVTGTAMDVLNIVFAQHFLEGVTSTSNFMFNSLKQFSEKTNLISNIRGKGFLIGFDVKADNKKVVADCLENGLIINAISNNSIRLSPPLILVDEDAEKGLNILYKVLKNQ